MNINFTFVFSVYLISEIDKEEFLQSVYFVFKKNVLPCSHFTKFVRTIQLFRFHKEVNHSYLWFDCFLFYKILFMSKRSLGAWMNFAQNQRVCQDRSSIHITEEKQMYLILKKKCVLELLLSTMQLFWDREWGYVRKKDRIF